ncbi:histidine phosphatase family protein [Roseateles oligotrophus]|uniref:Histidine phosphatase family protein n=1 Tax=Roseateles oligotrophus TaxID=1769250 RepID=A0ABT2YCG7_9BURK|nr:histidine phosphatase family protein [Roseateles oligotrophus]MCV2367720.1 histidine phosphatase family protein [Roseateles oligotrophus]
MNSSTQILAIRHGETDWNCLGRYQGQTDIPLNEQGLVQAKLTAQALASVPLDAIYTSDLARALQTAHLIAELKQMPLHIEPDLREQHFGVFQGLTSAEILQRWPEEHARWHRREAGFGPEGGESRSVFNARCMAAIERLALRHRGQAIALVCHGGLLDCLYRAAAGLGLESARAWPLNNAALSRLKHGPEGFTLLDWGNTSHLEASARDEVPESFPAP